MAQVSRGVSLSFTLLAWVGAERLYQPAGAC